MRSKGSFIGIVSHSALEKMRRSHGPRFRINQFWCRENATSAPVTLAAALTFAPFLQARLDAVEWSTFGVWCALDHPLGQLDVRSASSPISRSAADHCESCGELMRWGRWKSSGINMGKLVRCLDSLQGALITASPESRESKSHTRTIGRGSISVAQVLLYSR